MEEQGQHITERTPPTPSELAERAVCGAILQDTPAGDHFAAAQGAGLAATDLQHPLNRAIWEAVADLRAQGGAVDHITVGYALAHLPIMQLREYRGDRDRPGYLDGLVLDAPAAPESTAWHAQVIRRHAIGLQRAQAVHDLAQRPHDRALVARLDELHRQEATIGQGRRRLFDPAHFERGALAALARPIPPKLPFGLGPLDEALDGGFPSGGMVILGAPPKHHKTAFLISCTWEWAMSGERVLYVSTEQTTQEMLARLSSRAQFGHPGRWHSRIKYEPDRAAENLEPIRWLAGHVEVVSLLDEEARPDGLRWPAILDALAELDPPPILLADYVEELSLRAPAERGATEADRNKATLIALRDFAVRHRSRVLAVCSVPKASYGGSKDAVFNRHDAAPEEFVSVVKHSGFGEFAASAILALQLPQDVGEALINDGETGHRCLPMKLHLAMTREGRGPVTVPVLSFAGYCRFILDKRTREAKVNPLYALIEQELAKPVNQLGQSGKRIAELIGKRETAVNDALREMLALGTIWADGQPGPGKRIRWRHLIYAPKQPKGEQMTMEVGG